MSLEGKKILLGICGSIAAYKTPMIVRLLVKAGAEVKVVATPSSLDFVSPLALSTVSKHPLYHTLQDEHEWVNHIKLSHWADLILIAPVSCNTLAKMATGLCDNLLMSVYMSARCPIAIAPAMDEDMYLHPVTQQNIQTISQRADHYTLPVGDGELASGIIGQGRMLEPEDILTWVEDFFSQKKKLIDKKVLITAGPTYEAIDPVRFIGNHSTGKMGIALAQSAAEQGAQVVLVLGPSAQPSPTHSSIQTTRVTSALEMLAECQIHDTDADVIICSAAVADYTPVEVHDQKIKKSGGESLQINLKENPDILKTLASDKKPGQYIVGFALETNDEVTNAQKKLQSKNADMIVLNSLRDEGAGFGTDTNKVTLITADEQTPLPLMSKKEVADEIIAAIYAETADLPEL